MRTWDIKRSVFSVGDFVDWAKASTLELSPSFQRRPVWPKKAKSYLVDTIINGLPMPVIFLRERTDLSTVNTIREVVDGQQRLRTVISYISPSCIKDFDPDKDEFQIQKTHNKEFAGMRFADLTRDVQKRILSYQFSVDTLPSDTDDSDVLRIFARMNSTGTKLNDQELRNAEYFGEFKEAIYSATLQQLDRWRSWGIFKDDQIARMNEVELVSELVIYLLNEEIQSKTQSSINSVYKKFDDVFPGKVKTIRRFSEVLDLIDEIIGRDLSATAFSRPTLFYPFFAVVDEFYPQKKTKGLPSHSRFRDRVKKASDKIVGKSAPDNVIEASQRRLGHKSSREAIRKFLVDEINR